MIMLKLPAQTQKSPCVRRAIYKDKYSNKGDVESEDEDEEDEHTRGGEGKRPLTACQAALAAGERRRVVSRFTTCVLNFLSGYEKWFNRGGRKNR